MTVAEQEATIIALLSEPHIALSLDLLLIRVFRTSGEIWKRNTTASRLHRMVKQGSVQYAGSRGYYTLRSIVG